MKKKRDQRKSPDNRKVRIIEVRLYSWRYEKMEIRQRKDIDTSCLWENPNAKYQTVKAVNSSEFHLNGHFNLLFKEGCDKNCIALPCLPLNNKCWETTASFPVLDKLGTAYRWLTRFEALSKSMKTVILSTLCSTMNHDTLALAQNCWSGKKLPWTRFKQV